MCRSAHAKIRRQFSSSFRRLFSVVRCQLLRKVRTSFGELFTAFRFSSNSQIIWFPFFSAFSTRSLLALFSPTSSRQLLGSFFSFLLVCFFSSVSRPFFIVNFLDSSRYPLVQWIVPRGILRCGYTINYSISSAIFMQSSLDHLISTLWSSSWSSSKSCGMMRHLDVWSVFSSAALQRSKWRL